MKIKIFFLSLICILLGLLLDKQNELIKIPKDERELEQIDKTIITGKITHISDGDSFVMNDNIKIRLFAIDAPELTQTCILSEEILKETGETVTTTTEIKCGENAKSVVTIYS